MYQNLSRKTIYQNISRKIKPEVFPFGKYTDSFLKDFSPIL
jgi:hypothetical protein